MECINKHYRVDRKRIAFIRFIFEAYDGIAVLKTLDAETGSVMLEIPPGCLGDVEAVMTDLAKDVLIEPTNEP